MLHFGSFDIRTDVFVLLLCVIVMLLQIFICFKVKRKIVRLMPVYVTLILTVVFVILGFILGGWDGFGFFFLALCTAILLADIGIGWGIWTIVRKKDK